MPDIESSDSAPTTHDITEGPSMFFITIGFANRYDSAGNVDRGIKKQLINKK
jgi:hypothetical protein